MKVLEQLSVDDEDNDEYLCRDFFLSASLFARCYRSRYIYI